MNDALERFDALVRAEDTPNTEEAQAVLRYSDGREFSFEIVRDARRWWNYRNAYFNTVSVAAIDDPALLRFAGKAFSHEQYEANRLLERDDPLYFGAFARLENIRARAPDGERRVNPFYMERRYGTLILMNVMDEILDGPSGFPLSGTDTEAIVKHQYSRLHMQALLMRHYDGFDSSYSLQSFQQMPLGHNYRQPDLESEIMEHRRGVRYLLSHGRNLTLPLGENSSLEPLEIARSLPSSGNFSMERPYSEVT
ncbi:MAG: hypothetical protein ACREHG_04605 [Candidatus Saccharimonadales bacterium]